MKIEAMESSQSQWKTRLAGGVLAGLVLSMTVAINLPYRYTEIGGQWIGGRMFAESDVSRTLHRLPVMAGWPFRYWVRYEANDVTEDRLWSTPRLVANVLIGTAAAGLVFGFTVMRRRWIRRNNRHRYLQPALDCVVAFSIVALPLALIGSAYYTKHRHLQAIRMTRGFGNAYFAAWVPEIIASRVPANFSDVFSRVRYLKFAASTNEALAPFGNLGTLTGIELIGGDFDAAALDQFSDDVHFTFVQVRSRSLSQAHARSIAKLKYASELTLSRTNFDQSMMEELSSMRRLRWVDLRGTPLKLSEFGKPAWSSTIESLLLPRPPDGQPDKLLIEDWPKLKSLGVLRASLQLNDSLVEIRLSRLPMLANLRLNRVQKYSLDLSELPRLRRIDEDVTSLMFFMRSSDFVPGLTWLSDLKLDGLQSLTAIGCYAEDLGSLEIANVPNLRELRLGAYTISSGGGAELRPIRSGHCQDWIDEIGRGNGPVKVDLTGLPLDGVDLSPLVANPRVRTLNLGNSGLRFKQVRRLAGMTQLEELDLADCVLREGQLDWLLEHLPGLETLRANVTLLETMTLESGSSLRSLQATQFERLRELRLVDVPDLVAYLRLANTPERLEVREAWSLRGFALEQPWPRNAVFTGLRDLEWFSGGGPELGDEVVQELLACPMLERITLAHPSVSPELLARLGELGRLGTLNLPGAKVDDQVTAQWHRLDKLQDLDLSETTISRPTLEWLAGVSTLRRLTLNRLVFDDAAAAALAQLVQVADLSLAYTQMDDRWVIAAIDNQTLEQIDLSGWKLTPEIIAAVGRCGSLERLRLADCEMDDSTLRRLAQNNQSVRIDLGEDYKNVSEELAAKLADRLIVPRSTRGNLNVIATTENFYQLVNEAVSPQAADADESETRRIWAFYELEPGTIDPEPFRQTEPR